MTRAPLLAAVLLAACGGKDKDSTPPASPCTDLAATASSVVSTAVTFSWSTRAAGTPSVTLDLDGESLTVQGSASGTDHAVTAVGLVAGGDYTWTASVDTGSEVITCEPQTVKVAPPPGTVLRFDINVSEPGSAAADGYFVISTLLADSSWTAVVDGQGRYRFIKALDEDWYTTARARLSRDGGAILYNQFDRDRVLDIGNIRRVSWDGTVDTTTRTWLAHHDFVELPGGGFGWLGYDRRDAPMDIAGAPPGAEADQHCTGGLCPLAGEVLLEGAEGITADADAIEVVNWWDDWDTDPYWVCDHMWDFDSFVPDYYELFHANSIAYVDSEDAYYVMSRYQDVLFKVDRATGRIVWQLGGIDSDFALTAGEWFDHGHMSEVWEGGFLVFDNGDHRGYTRVSEYAWDEATMTAEVVWSMDHPTQQMLPILGDVRRLPNGNRLVVWSADALMQEITPEGTVVWELQSASGGFGVIARAEYLAEIPQPAN